MNNSKLFGLNVIRSLACLAVTALMLLAMGCKNENDDNDSGYGGSIRFVNAISGVSLLGMEISDADQGTVEYGYASDYISLIVGTKSLSFYTIDSNGKSSDLDISFDYYLADYTDALIILYGSSDNIQYKIVTADAFEEDSDTGYAQVGFVNLSNNAPSLDMYLTNPVQGVYEVDAVTGADYGEFSGMTQIDGDEYEIQFTTGGTKDVVYDGGTVDIEEENNYFYITLDYSSANASNIIAVEVGGQNASRHAVDIEGTARLRFINGIYDYSSVDVYFGDTTSEPVFSNVSFGDASSYLSIDSGDYSINITPHGVTYPFLFEKDISIVGGGFSSLLVAGSSADGEVKSAIIADKVQKISDRASISFVHASPSSSDIDVYVLVPGQPVSDATPVVSDLAYLASYDLEKNPGNYEITLVKSSNEAVVLSRQPLKVTSGDVLDVYFMDYEGGGTPGHLEYYKYSESSD